MGGRRWRRLFGIEWQDRDTPETLWFEARVEEDDASEHEPVKVTVADDVRQVEVRWNPSKQLMEIVPADGEGTKGFRDITWMDATYRVVAPAHVTVTREDTGEEIISSRDQANAARFEIRNFAGFRVFTVHRNNRRLTLRVEFIPYKIAYRNEYDIMVSEVAGALGEALVARYGARGLVSYETRRSRPPDDVWLRLLESLIEKLDRALKWIAVQPHRRLVRHKGLVPAWQVRRVDAPLVREVAIGHGAGDLWELEDGIFIRQKVWTSVSKTTTDIPEHRWIAARIRRIRSRLVAIKERLSSQEQGELRQKVEALLKKATVWSSLGPFSTTQPPPDHFTSMLFQNTPGYRDAYECLEALEHTLELQESVRELFPIEKISDLYEIWVLVKLHEALGGSSEELSSLAKGVIDVAKKRSSVLGAQKLRIEVEGTSVILYYHKTYKIGASSEKEDRRAPNDEKGKGTLQCSPNYKEHEPDFVLHVGDEKKPRAMVILDAKYRRLWVGGDDKQGKKRRSAPGGGGCWVPPQETFDSMRRYRDVLTHQYLNEGREIPYIWGVVLYPVKLGEFGENHGTEDPMEGINRYRRTGLWQGLRDKRLRLGAIPMSPGDDGWQKLVREFINGIDSFYSSPIAVV